MSSCSSRTPGARPLPAHELLESPHRPDPDLPGGDRSHGQRGIDEAGGRGIRVAGNRQISGYLHSSRPRLSQHTEGEHPPCSEDSGRRLGSVEEPRQPDAARVHRDSLTSDTSGGERRPPPPGLEIVPVADVETLQTFERTAIDAYPLPELAGLDAGTFMPTSLLDDDRFLFFLGSSTVSPSAPRWRIWAPRCRTSSTSRRRRACAAAATARR